MKRRIVLLFAISAVVLLASVGSAAAAPTFKILTVAPSDVAPGETFDYTVDLRLTTKDATDGNPYTLVATLPAGLSIVSYEIALDIESNPFWNCETPNPQSFACTADAQIGGPGSPGSLHEAAGNDKLRLTVTAAPSASGILTASFDVYGGGAIRLDGSSCASAPSGVPCASAVDPTTVTTEPIEFGVDAFDGQISANAAGGPSTQAGGSPYSAGTKIDFNSQNRDVTVSEAGKAAHLESTAMPVQTPRDIVVEPPPGLIGNPTAVDQCTTAQLTVSADTPITCPNGSQVGVALFRFAVGGGFSPLDPVPVYNMIPPAGSPARFGMNVLGNLVFIEAELRSGSDYGITLTSRAISEGLTLLGPDVTLWGVPASPAHDTERYCTGMDDPTQIGQGPTCASSATPKPFLRLPTSCVGPQTWTMHADSWQNPGVFKHATFISHDPPGFPANPHDPVTPWGGPQGTTGCDVVPVKGKLSAQPTSQNAETSTGLNVTVSVPNPGLENPTGISSSDIEKVRVSLPEGVSINPSQGDGLGVCTPTQYASEELSFHPSPNVGCPSTSKIGTVTVHTPLLEEALEGDVYVAAPFENPFDSLLALYIVLKNPERGVMVKLAGKVDPNPNTGQLVTTFDNLPQLPFSTFELRFREGVRAPLATPRTCGKYTTKAEFTPWSDHSRAIVSQSSFEIIHGVDGGPCPSGGTPPFHPGLIAGTLNNNAGSYSPFNLRLFRSDGEQEITHFSIKLPPGLVGKLAGVPFCPDAAIEAAKAPSRTGAQELASPSCPQASEVGRTLVGAGVGSVLAYAPGKVYLAGPYHGSALSIAAITAAKVGPFDLGTVVVRQALKINPDTAEVFIDATGSDPIPHIIDGITTHLRDIRAYVDKPEFTLNPTNCNATSTASTVLGSGLDFASEADDQPVTVTTRFQAANCANLGFKPKLALSLRGGTKRGDNPALKAVLTARKGDANIGKAQVTLPHSEFLDQSHIKTICTRVQFAQGTVPGERCPAGSIYGYAKAITPLLDEPLQGPVFLRSSSHNLPDLLATLQSGRININLAGRIDSVGKDGRIRSSFDAVPDAPVTKFILTMKGGKKGLLVNSTNLCARPNRAIAAFTGQNGKVHNFNPVLKPRCAKKHKKKG